MPFQKGQPRPANAGRKAGTASSKTLNVRQICERLGCDPFEGMARLANNPKSKPELRGRMYAELAQYCAPKLRAIEHTGKDGKDLFDIASVRAYAQSIPDEDTTP